MIREILLVIHIFLACIWVGGILFVGWGVYPAAAKMELHVQRRFLLTLMNHVHHLFTLAGFGVILSGILLGTVFGPIHSIDMLWHTAYGKTWLAALITGSITLFWGVCIGYQEMKLIFTDIFLWQEAANGNKKPLYRELIRLAALESVEAIGFTVLIILMVTF